MEYLLTEDNIKHCTLGFLKSYYKNNSSRGFGKTEVRLNMITADGIIADGYLKFSLIEEGQATKWNDLLEEDTEEPLSSQTITNPQFLATFEATSQESAEEIQYKVQNTLLLMDALAVAFILTACSYGFNYFNEQFTLNELGFFKFWLGFLAVLLTTLLGYMLIFRYFPRYRYIFAIEQFERYYADEQWISYGEDVFASPDNKYLLELKKQCVRKGLGLITVNYQLQPNLIMTPAREYVGGTRKKIKEFFTSSANIVRTRFSWFKLPNWLKKRLGLSKVSTRSPNKYFQSNDYLRYTKSYWKQSLLVIFSVIAMGEIYVKELNNPNVVYLDEKEYERKVLEQARNNKETGASFLDLEKEETSDARHGAIPTDGEYIDRVIEVPPTIPKKDTALFKPKTSSTPEKAIIVTTDTREYISYPCNRIAHLKGEVYLIQIDITKEYDRALALVKAYTEQGLKVNALSLACFYKNNFEYVIYLDDIYDSKSEAVDRASQYNKLKVTKGGEQTQVLIRVLKRMI